ncbi:endoplasmic reticulum lectin 1 isoform X1 [Anopheles cruzii]|uniref:endoplasmic reticulum lectin 1 isoform X1 n=1 Tax=Anopheles cruzii TaxID=68878 RepID=UPI0022EC5785|nr:endoplasmic reticulum lectin 1 isoform X1 [Anopheles cruzii]
MELLLLFTLLGSSPLLLVRSHDLKGFDDSVLFNLVWHTKDELVPSAPDAEEVVITSANKEKYRCMIPSITAKESTGDVEYAGPTPLELLEPLFLSTSCSYRIESYWSYEVCHGNYIKQYHEERHEKTSKLQEYFLGRWDKQKTEALKVRLAQSDAQNEQLKYKKIEGFNLPYLELEMDSGTVCDLNGEPRVTKVLYVCYMFGKNEVYSLKETSTCNYEVIILTAVLCTHPKYKPQDTEENKINCSPIGDSPRKPKALLEMEIEKLRQKYQQLSVTISDVLGFEMPELNEDGSARGEPIRKDTSYSFDWKVVDVDADEGTTPVSSMTRRPKKSKELTSLLEFLDGAYCLPGGSGWWKFELCFGKHVRQYHKDTSIYLGYFDVDKHREWLEKNPLVRFTRKNDNQISHFYTGGDVCDKTNQPRHVEVKLKCTEHSATSDAIGLYLLEPRPCEYVLNVESSKICDILPLASDDMLLPENLQHLDEETLLVMDSSNSNNNVND